MNKEISDAYRPSSVGNRVQKARKAKTEQGEAIVALGFSVLSLFTLAVLWGITLLSPSSEKLITPGLVLLICIPTGCAGVLAPPWVLIFRPGWIPVLAVFAGVIAILAALWLSYLFCWARSGIV